MIAVEFTIEELRFLKEANDFFRLEQNLTPLDNSTNDAIRQKLNEAIRVETTRENG